MREAQSLRFNPSHRPKPELSSPLVTGRESENNGGEGRRKCSRSSAQLRLTAYGGAGDGTWEFRASGMTVYTVVYHWCYSNILTNRIKSKLKFSSFPHNLVGYCILTSVPLNLTSVHQMLNRGHLKRNKRGTGGRAPGNRVDRTPYRAQGPEFKRPEW